MFSFCLSDNVDSSRTLGLVSRPCRHLHSHSGVCWRLTGPDFGFSNTPQRLDSELASPGSQVKWCRSRSSQVTRRQLTTVGMGWLTVCCTDTVQLQQLIIWKGNIRVLFFSMTEGLKLSPSTISRFNKNQRVLIVMEKAGGRAFFQIQRLNHLDRP